MMKPVKRTAKKQYTIWDTVFPYYCILKTLGLTPFKIVGDIKDGKIKTTIFDVIQTIIVFIIQCYFLYANVIKDFSLSRTNSFFIDNGAHEVEIFNALNVIIGTVFYTSYRKKIWSIFRNCHEFDKEVHL